jgi:protease-4
LDRDEIALMAAPHRSLLDRIKPPESTEDLAMSSAAKWLPDAVGLAASVYAALGLPPVGVLTMPMSWHLT